MTIEEKQELKQKTVEKLNEMKAELVEKQKAKQLEINEAYAKILQMRDNIKSYLEDIFKQYITNEVVLVISEGKLQKPYDWSDDADAEYSFTCDVGLRTKDANHTWADDSFILVITNDKIKMNTCGYSTFSRKDRPCVSYLLTLQGYAWLYEETLVKNAKLYVDVDALNNERKLRNERYPIDADITVIENELKRREEEKEIAGYIELLKTHKYYHFKKETPYHETERFYKIVKVTEKRVRMIEIGFSSWSGYKDNDYQYMLSEHSFDLYTDVLKEMHRGEGEALNDINWKVEEMRKLAEQNQ